jgi:acyl carrier protein
MNYTHEMIRTAVTNWVSIQSGVAPEDISEETALIGGELLDSFALVSLTSLVEKLANRSLTDAELEPENFLTIEAIMSIFFCELEK